MKIINVERLSPNHDTGLNSEQFALRKKAGLVNVTKKKYSKSVLSIFIDNIFTFFNMLGLLVVISLLYAGAGLFDYVFVVVYIANITIGIVQELRAKYYIDKLSIISNKSTKVIRDGVIIEVSAKNIVLDDVILLSMGSQIPTDCILLSGEIEVNESLLTGESEPVKKQAGDVLYCGSFVTGGNCYAKADKVGEDNYVEILSKKAKKYKKPHSELMNSLRYIIKVITFIIIPMALLYVIKSFFITKLDLPTSILTTSAVIIGMIPSGMFLLTSLALAVGTIKLAKNNTLVQDLYSLEMLARVDTICFDKTGTITDGRMQIQDVIVIDPDSTYSIDDVMSSMLGVLNDNNQTAIALHDKFGDKKTFESLASIPFNSMRKLSAVTFKDMGTFSFGAPEFILSEEEFQKIEGELNVYLAKGNRVLLVAHSNKPIIKDELPDNFKPLAFIIIVDNIREDAYDTVKWFKENDVAIKVISGDNPITVAEVSKRVGILNADKYVSLDKMTDEEVYKCANEYTVFGRVSPEQKAILIKAIKDAGHITAMTGDGVNDILALKESDCAITVASGSEATRNIAHLVLMDNNFNSMPKVVYEGRRVINNVQSSSSLYLMKTLFVIMFAFITLFLSPAYPFTLRQMNILELLIIGFPSFILSLQPNDARVNGDFINNVFKKSLASSLLMLISVMLIMLMKKLVGTNEIITEEVYSTIEILALSFAGLISLYRICSPFNALRAWLFLAVLSAMFVLTVIIIANGLSFLGMCILTPFPIFWPYIILLLCIIFLDIPLSQQLIKLCDAISLPEKLFKKKEK